MKVGISASADTNAFYRCTEPGRVARDVGVDVVDLQLQGIFDGNRMVGLEPVDVDVAVMARPTHMARAQAVGLLQEQGVAVVVELDDDAHALTSQHPAKGLIDPAVNPFENVDHLARACRDADLLTCTTLAIADRYGRDGQVAVIDNCVPAAWLDVEPSRTWDRPTVVWGATPSSHPTDLTAVGDGLRRALEATGARFVHVGGGHEAVRQRFTEQGRLEGWPHTTWIEQVEHGEYPGLLASFDVAIAPLIDTPFNRARSRLKMLEAAALGVAPVGSPIPAYRDAYQRGVGYLAHDPDDWAGQLTGLLELDDLRATVVQHARQAAADLTYEANAHRWVDAWERAVAIRRGVAA